MPEDTLYMVFEEDFRWWRPGFDPDEADDYGRKTKPTWKTPKEKPVSLPPPAKGGEEGKGKGKKGEKGKTPRAQSEWHGGVERGTADPGYGPDWGLRQEVADAIRIANFAHRQGVGHLMNMCWVAQGHQWTPTNGTMLMMVSKTGARALSSAMQSLPPGHIDLVWKQWLKSDAEVQREVGFSFLSPPMGNYTQHISDCDPKLWGEHTAGRPADWDKPFCCAGTRVEEDPQRREKWLCQFATTKSKKGRGVTWQAKLPRTDVLHNSEEFWWKSFQEGYTPGDGTSERPFDEPTAAECGTGKGTELSRRQRRLGRKRRALDQMRIWVADEREAGFGKDGELHFLNLDGPSQCQASCIRMTCFVQIIV